MDTDGNGQIFGRRKATYLAAAAQRLIGNLKLSVKSQSVAMTLEPNSGQLSFKPGQGGLDICVWEMWLDAPSSFRAVRRCNSVIRITQTAWAGAKSWFPARQGISIENSNGSPRRRVRNSHSILKIVK